MSRRGGPILPLKYVQLDLIFKGELWWLGLRKKQKSVKITKALTKVEIINPIYHYITVLEQQCDVNVRVHLEMEPSPEVLT